MDTSALVKLVVREPETEALRGWLGASPRHPVSCDLARTELMRAVRRAAPDRAPDARRVLGAVTLIQVTTAIFEQAARVEPAAMRSLDAIHLAAALDLGDDLDGLVTYDSRMAEATGSAGIQVLSPA